MSNVATRFAVLVVLVILAPGAVGSGTVPSDKCVIPVRESTTASASCPGEGKVYEGKMLVHAGGFEIMTSMRPVPFPCVPCVPCDGDDADGDGFCPDAEEISEADWDDSNSAVYPEATQIFDGFNNDCEHPHWPALVEINEVDDKDGDGFPACTDCDDAAANVYLGAAQECAQECDRVNNDRPDTLWPRLRESERDRDDDGFAACEADWDDENRQVHPGAQELRNQRHDDCDGNVDEGPGIVPGSTVGQPGSGGVAGLRASEIRSVQDPAAWTASGTETDEQFGFAVAFAGDVDTNGFDDAIVGSPFYQSANGRALVYLGSEAGLAQAASWEVTGTAGELFGYSVAAAGDVNGDGYGDLVVGAPDHDESAGDNVGRARVFSGSPLPLDTLPIWTVKGTGRSDRFGTAVGSAGDINGDGRHDLLVGAENTSASGEGDDDKGRVRLFLTGPTGLSTSPAWEFAGQSGARLGTSVASAGDVNADGFIDIIVGEPRYAGGESSEGRALVFYGLGQAPWFSAIPDWTAEGNELAAGFGNAVSAGNVNGDDYDDVIVGAHNFGPGSDGAVFVYLGSQTGLSMTPTIIPGPTNSRFGKAVAGAGDADADGFDDVLVGAYTFQVGSEYRGAAFLYRGTVSGIETMPAWSAEGEQSGSGFGWSVALAGDVDGDCASDLLIGDDTHPTAGKAYLYSGSPTDTDSDGLCDAWELRGIDVNNDSIIDLDLPGRGANHLRKDLFIEIDTMDGLAPPTNVTDLLKAEFADAPLTNPSGTDGISIHYESGDSDGVDEPNIKAIRWADECEDGAKPGFRSQFVAAKTKHFGTPVERGSVNRHAILRAKSKTFRYAIVASYFGDGTVGVAEILGNDVIVALNEDANSSLVDDEQRASALMHELGHTLGLQHSGEPGNEDRLFNYKPNYHSVMNNLWVFRDSQFGPWELTYSEGIFNTLVENDLDEMEGIGGHPGHTVSIGPPKGKVVSESGMVDWNDDEDFDDASETRDVNFVVASSPNQTLVGAADWPNLVFTLVGPAYSADGDFCGTAGELTFAEYEQSLEGFADCNSNGLSDHDDIGGCVSLDCNGDGVPDDCQIASGAVEDLNDNNVPDECECSAVPPATTLALQINGTYAIWSATSAGVYDLIRGDLLALRASDGDFSTSVLGCLVNNVRLTSLVDEASPISGEAWFYLARDLNCAGNGSLDSGGSSQVGSRDAEADASSASCPSFDCGNGILETGETCDWKNLDCETCVSQGFSSGTLQCNDTCDGYDTTDCS